MAREKMLMKIKQYSDEMYCKLKPGNELEFLHFQFHHSEVNVFLIKILK